ncbi:hypothetical protein NOVOSPHI9U_580027 [Novosphingobium sp. 9U]|nr:hypothetical protein NOVOSPHI9U_580027 [Novosphingobium sp. 9U]
MTRECKRGSLPRMTEVVESKITVNRSSHQQPRSGYQELAHHLTSTSDQRDILAEFWAAHDSVPLSAIAHAQRRASSAPQISRRTRRRG